MATTVRSPLGEQLRQYRTSAGFSQAALAEAAGLSLRGVSDLERGLKTRPHPSTLRMLADALDLDPGQRAALAALSRPSRLPVRTELAATAPPPGLIGRDAERARLRQLLADPAVRIVTITGPGGVGKTRLGRDLAATVPACTFVDLAPLANDAAVLATIAARLGVRDDGGRPLLQVVRDALADREAVLLLDNCEHVLDGVRAAILDLEDLPGLRAVATSRSPLRLSGERLLPLSPLAVPAADAGPDEVAAADAVRLLVDRARDVNPRFEVTNENADAVREMCVQVDGLPLAIELAASRLRTIPPHTLATLLDQRLRVLTTGPLDAPARHQSLRATIAWSCDLLDPGQRALFRTLSVFVGGFTLEAATRVAGEGDPFATIDGIAALADQALLTVAEDGRYRMLEMVREFGLGELAASGDEAAIRNAHAAAMLAFAAGSGDGLGGPDAASWLDRFAAEEANLLAALDWLIGLAAAGGDASPAVSLVVQLWPWWHMQGRHHDSQRWLDRVIALGNGLGHIQRAGVYLVLANAANNLEQHARARDLYAESHRIAREAGDGMLVLQSLIGLGLELVAAAEFDQADATLAEALRMAEQGDAERALMPAMYAVCRLEIARGNHAQAHRCLDRAIEMVEPEDVGSRAYLQLERAPILRVDGRLPEALALVRSCRETFVLFGDRRALAACDIELAHLARVQGDDRVAGELFLSTGRDCLGVRDELNLVRAVEGLAALAIGRNQPVAAVALETVTRTWRFRTGTAREFWEQLVVAAIPADALGASLPGFEDALRLGEDILATTAPRGEGRSSIDQCS